MRCFHRGYLDPEERSACLIGDFGKLQALVEVAPYYKHSVPFALDWGFIKSNIKFMGTTHEERKYL